MTLNELGEAMMVTISDKNFTENPFRRNHSKLIVQMLFCVGLLDEKTAVYKACLQSVYSIFRTQVAVSYLF
jgi:hypothetical protein